jgi:hypothetical protein
MTASRRVNMDVCRCPRDALCERCLGAVVGQLRGVAACRGDAWAEAVAQLRPWLRGKPWPYEGRTAAIAHGKVSDLGADPPLLDALGRGCHEQGAGVGELGVVVEGRDRGGPGTSSAGTAGQITVPNLLGFRGCRRSPRSDERGHGSSRSGSRVKTSCGSVGRSVARARRREQRAGSVRGARSGGERQARRMSPAAPVPHPPEAGAAEAAGGNRTWEICSEEATMRKHHRNFVEQLRSAFPAEPIRGDAAFAQWGGSYPDASSYEQAVDGKTWEQLDHAYILRRNDSLGFLSTQQLVQILPVYLLSVVEEGVMSPALDAVLVKLTRPTREPGRERFDAFVAALDGSQRTAVATALRCLTEEDPDGSPGRAALAALNNFWNEYL